MNVASCISIKWGFRSKNISLLGDRRGRGRGIGEDFGVVYVENELDPFLQLLEGCLLAQKDQLFAVFVNDR
jgi:hypothetical protein